MFSVRVQSPCSESNLPNLDASKEGVATSFALGMMSLLHRAPAPPLVLAIRVFVAHDVSLLCPRIQRVTPEFGGFEAALVPASAALAADSSRLLPESDADPLVYRRLGDAFRDEGHARMFFVLVVTQAKVGFHHCVALSQLSLLFFFLFTHLRKEGQI